jgi:hypothetical protein
MDLKSFLAPDKSDAMSATYIGVGLAPLTVDLYMCLYVELAGRFTRFRC